MTNAAPIDMSAYQLDEDNLITYREFMQALRGMDEGALYKNLLPRTLSFEDVLKTQAIEEEYTISDTQIDDFYMFRYELHSMLNKHLFESEDESKEQIFLLGKRPLSKVQGVPVKDMIKNLQQKEKQENDKRGMGDKKEEKNPLWSKCYEIYAPPGGVVKTTSTKFQYKSVIKDSIKNAVP